ncbi:hypothetical protein H8957_017594, partial [Semnopithecus entellus]
TARSAQGPRSSPCARPGRAEPRRRRLASLPFSCRYTMSSSSDRRFRTASWMGLALCALRLATSARGRISWKASPLRTAMGRHLARKSTKPATAIKFNTSSTLTLLSEAIKQPSRPSPRSAPRDAYSVHGAQPLPGVSGKGQGLRGLSSAPARGSPLDL